MTAVRPTPVLLVPGWSDSAAFLGPLRDRFVDAGWAPSEVRTHAFEDPFGSNVSHARELAESVREMASQAGVDSVDVVAHSMGGLAVRHLVLHLDSTLVRRVVFLATPHAGTYIAYFAWGTGGLEMRPRSSFLRSVGTPLPVPSLSVYTPVDTHVLPISSAVERTGRKVRVWCSHRGIVRHAGAFERTRAFLRASD